MSSLFAGIGQRQDNFQSTTCQECAVRDLLCWIKTGERVLKSVMRKSCVVNCLRFESKWTLHRFVGIVQLSQPIISSHVDLSSVISNKDDKTWQSLNRCIMWGSYIKRSEYVVRQSLIGRWFRFAFTFVQESNTMTIEQRRITIKEAANEHKDQISTAKKAQYNYAYNNVGSWACKQSKKRFDGERDVWKVIVRDNILLFANWAWGITLRIQRRNDAMIYWDMSW